MWHVNGLRRCTHSTTPGADQSSEATVSTASRVCKPPPVFRLEAAGCAEQGWAGQGRAAVDDLWAELNGAVVFVMGHLVQGKVVNGSRVATYRLLRNRGCTHDKRSLGGYNR